MKPSIILATCYAVNPYKGSEDAMGWNFVYQIARYRKVIAITRENNQYFIEKFMKENPDEIYQNITFLYYDLPYWVRFWKKGNRGALLYFYLWQKNIVNFIKSKNLEFDIVHNVNFHNDWTPTFLWKLKKPLVWGPVGHHPLIPKQYFKFYSSKFYWKDRLTWLVKKIFWTFSPSLKKSVKNADHIWCMNSAVPNVLNLQEPKFSIYPSIASEDFSDGEIFEKEKFNILSVGRFVPLKGFDITINAFAEFLNQLSEEKKSECKLTLVGTGSEKQLYQHLISKHNIENNIEIIEWVDRKSLMEIYKKSSIFLFPSHEGAGMVVAEALSFGLPVICLDNIGPGEFINSESGFVIPQEDYEKTVVQLSDALLQLFFNENLLKKMSKRARNLYEEKFSWQKRGDYLDQIYKKIES